jgi:hypothetical protein
MSNAALRLAVAALLCIAIPASPLVAFAAPAGAPAAPAGAAAPAVSAPDALPVTGPSPSPVSTAAAPVYGDLSHLEFTATGPLTAQLVAPEPGGASDREAATFEVSTVAGAGVELEVAGVIVEAKHIGKRTIDKKTGETHYFYYGVHLAAGPNDVSLTPLGAGNLRGLAFRTTVYGPGQPERVQAKLVGDLRADGHTAAILQIMAFDRWDHSALPGSTVHVTILKGDAHFESVRHHRDATAGAGGLPVPVAGATTQPVTGLLSNDVPPGPVAIPTNAADVALNGDEYGDPVAASAQGQNLNYSAIGDSNAQFQSLDVLLLSHGTATLAVVPGLVPGDLVIHATVADAQNEVRAFIEPALRKPMVLGLVTAGAGSVPGVPGESANAPDDANSRKGRIALYGVGQIAKNAQATVAYDTADTLDLNNNYGSFDDNPEARPYQTFGDASLRRDDALSRDHLYARIDDNRSSAMWGEFQADTGGTSGIGGFSQLVDGAKVEIAGSNAKATIFQARNDIAYARQVFSPSGLSNLGGLLHPQIVVGSDTVTLVALDRRTGAVLSQVVLTRNVDYALDYDSGFLRFINPPLPFDAYFNPQQILITYEYGGTGVNAETTGGRFEDAIGKSQAVRFGIGYVNDSTGNGNLAMSNEDISGNLRSGSWSIGHIATQGSLPDSVGVANTQFGTAANANGNAYRFALATALGVTKVDLGFDTTSENFNNPFGGFSTPGLLDYRAAFTRPFAGAGSITASFDHQQNNIPGSVTAQSDASIHARLPLSSRLTATAGVDLRSQSASSQTSIAAAALAAGAAGAQQVNPVPTPSAAAASPLAPLSDGQGATQAEIGLQYKVNKIVQIQASRIENLGNGQNAAQPAQTTAEIDADIAKRGRVYIRQLWSDAPTTSFAAATAQLTGIDGARSSTAIGIERSLGHSTDVDSEYVVDHTASGDDAYAEIGVREKLSIGPNLRGEASFQRASTFGGATQSLVGADSTTAPSSSTPVPSTPSASGFDIYGLSLAYSIARFHASGEYDLRTGNQRGYTLDVGAAGALSPDFTAFVASNATSSGAGFNNVDAKATLAYRPSLNDRGVTLISYERQDGDVAELGTHAEILSLEELVRPTRQTEIAARFAYKLDGDSYYPARSSLFGVRIDQRLAKRFDLAAETRFLNAHNIPNASTTAFALEAGYRVGDALRLAAGYNFSGSPDPSLVAAPTRRGVYGTVTSVIDSVFGWGRDDH